jgi:hypothetical protein
MNEVKPLGDDDPMPFGTFKRYPMKRVPAWYLDWLIDQPWISSHARVEAYILANKKLIDAELEAKEND